MIAVEGPVRVTRRPRCERLVAFLVVAVLGQVGCSPWYRVVPDSPLKVQVDELGVELERVEIEKGNAGQAFNTVLVVTLTNTHDHELPFDAARLRLARSAREGELAKPADASNTSTAEGASGRSSGAGGLGGAAMAGAEVGGALTGGGGVAGIGSAVGAGVGLAAAGLILLPVAIYLVIEREMARPPGLIGSGQVATFKLNLGGTRLDTGDAYHLLLGEAVGRNLADVQLALVRPEDEHLGYGEPTPRQYIGVRLGGGPLYLPGGNSGVGGAEILGGRNVGRWGLGGALTFAPLSLSTGLELRYAIPLADRKVLLVPTADLTAHLLILRPGGFAVGSNLGVELLFAMPGESWFDWSVPWIDLGIFARAGPVWHSDNLLGAGWQIGFVAR